MYLNIYPHISNDWPISSNIKENCIKTDIQIANETCRLILQKCAKKMFTQSHLQQSHQNIC